MDLSLAQSLRRQNQDEVIHVKHYILRLKLDKTKKLPNKLVFDKSTGDIDLIQKVPLIMTYGNRSLFFSVLPRRLAQCHTLRSSLKEFYLMLASSCPGSVTNPLFFHAQSSPFYFNRWQAIQILNLIWKLKQWKLNL